MKLGFSYEIVPLLLKVPGWQRYDKTAVYAVETCKKGEVQKEYTIKLNLIVCLSIWIIKRALYPLPTVFSTVSASHDFHETVPNTEQVFPGMADQG